MAVAGDARTPKDLRFRNQLFPDAALKVFDTKGGGFVPLPIVLRKLMPCLSLAEFRLLIYLHLRSSKHHICYPSMEEMLHELAITSKKHLLPPLRSLEEKGFISTAVWEGRRFVLIHNPRVAITRLRRRGLLSEAQMAEINELYEDLGQLRIGEGEPIEA